MLQIDKREWILSIAKLIKEDDLVRKTDAHSVVGAMDLASVLGTIGPPARCAGPYLKSLLDHPHNGIRWHTIVAATMIGLQDEFADRVIPIANTCRHFEVREQAVRLLGQVTKPTDQVIEVLEQRFQKDENKFVRLLAAHSLTKLNPKHARARAFILRCTREAKNRDLRAMAVRLLATVPGTDDQIIAALADRLDDPDEHVCLDVAETIGHLGKNANKLKIQIETAALTSPHVRARPLFAAALIRVDPKNATAQRLLRANLATVKDMLLMPEKQWRLFGVEVIGLMDVERAAVEPDIRKRVKDEDPLVREAAGRVLKNLKKRSR
jgi:HEAT repeat protein